MKPNLLSRENYEEKLKRLSFSKQCLIDGKYADALDSATYSNISPINDEEIGTFSAGNKEDIDRAVKIAREKFEKGVWANTSPKHKKKILHKWADLIEKNREELSLLETLDTGKPIRYSSTIDIHHCLDTVRFYAEGIDKIYGQVANTAHDAVGMITREPLGVVGAITPWNFPMMMAAWKIVPALAMGNSVVLKPAEQTPITAIKLASLALEAGLPEGVLNVVPGFGETAGKALALHDDVDAISFTGSTGVAKLLLQYAGQSNMKRVSAETGGKSPNIIFEDAYDLEFAAKQAAFSIFFNSGAMCVAGSRLLIQESVKDQVVDWLKEMTRKITVGHPLDASSKMGPIIDNQQFEKIEACISMGKSQGGNLVFGGHQTLEELGQLYMQPAIFTGVKNEMSLAQEEIFGPVISIITFKDEKEAVKIANDTIYGLNAGLWTSDLSKAHRMAKAIKAGTIWVNNWEGTTYAMPFGGFKQSGFGGKDKSLYALDKYSNIKTTWIQIDGAGAIQKPTS